MTYSGEKNTNLHVAAISFKLARVTLASKRKKQTNKQTNKKGVQSTPFIADTLATLT